MTQRRVGQQQPEAKARPARLPGAVQAAARDGEQQRRGLERCRRRRTSKVWGIFVDKLRVLKGTLKCVCGVFRSRHCTVRIPKARNGKPKGLTQSLKHERGRAVVSIL